MKKFVPILLFSILLLIARPSYAKIYRIKKGDTLARIARRYKTSVKKLKLENGLSSSRLKPGGKLRIPAAGRHRTGKRSHLARRTRTASHKLARVETKEKMLPNEAASVPETGLSTSARTAQAPGIPDSDAPKTTLSNGGKIADSAPEAGPGYETAGASQRSGAGAGDSESAVPVSYAKTGLSNSIRASIINSMINESARQDRIMHLETPWRAEDEIFHRVKRGETLFSIARLYGTSAKKLRKLNHIRTKRARLKPGQKLIIKFAAAKKQVPRTYTIKRGDTFLKIARKFHLKAEDLMDINELDPCELQPGMTIQLFEDDSPSETADSRVTAPQVEARIKELEDSNAIQSLSMKDRLLLFAKTMMNIPYRFGGTSFYGIDCSAFVQKMFNLLDIPLPRTAREQYQEGVPVSLEDLSIGDLVFFRTYASFPSHVGIYIGENLFVHASSGGRRVKIGNLKAPYFMNRIIGAKRLLTGQDLPLPGETQ